VVKQTVCRLIPKLQNILYSVNFSRPIASALTLIILYINVRIVPQKLGMSLTA